MIDAPGPKIEILSRPHLNIPRIQILSRNDSGTTTPAHENVRRYLLRRHREFGIEMTMDQAEGYGQPLDAVGMKLIAEACRYTKPFQHDDFDYLRRSTRRIFTSTHRSSTRLKVSYKISYLTSRTEEEQLDHELRKLLYENGAYAISDHIQRVQFAYNFIATNVTYDKALENLSAYDAVFKNSAVCEGCATLLYRLLSMLGVRSRIITGLFMDVPHAWNIVRLNRRWYNADVTWDLGVKGSWRGRPRYRFFLVGERWFSDHVRDTDFRTAEFVSSHPMSNEHYE